MIRTIALAALATGPAFAHSGHGAPATHMHMEEFAVLAIAAAVAFIAFRTWRAR